MSLTELVDRLSSEHSEEFKIIDRVTGQPERVVVSRRPLLADLEDAARVTKNRSARGSSSSSPLVPVDLEIVELTGAIAGELHRDLMRMGITAFRYGSLSTMMRRWYGIFQGSYPLAQEIYVWSEILTRWEEGIRAIVEPVKVREVMEPCPVCGDADYITDGGERRSMLTITYNEDSPAATTQLICQKCEVLAIGAGAVATALRIERVQSKTL